MRDRVFLDTNILVYLYSADEDDKRNVSYAFVNNADCFTSIQAMNESSTCGLESTIYVEPQSLNIWMKSKRYVMKCCWCDEKL